MEKIDMAVEVRTKAGKGVARSLRREGRVPGVLYGLKKDAVPLSADKKTILRLLNGAGGVEHSLLQLSLEGGAEKASRWAIIKEFQVDPVRHELLHVDFLEVSLEKKVKVAVPVEFEGMPAAVKMGGILQRLLREIEVECLPTAMPGTLVLDISHLEMNKSLHASDIPMPEGVSLATPAEETVVMVSEPRKIAAGEEEEAAAVAGAEPTAGEAAPAGESSESGETS